MMSQRKDLSGAQRDKHGWYVKVGALFIDTTPNFLRGVSNMAHEGIKLLNLLYVRLQSEDIYWLIERSIEGYEAHFGPRWKEW
jgi:hypothetical protein